MARKSPGAFGNPRSGARPEINLARHKISVWSEMIGMVLTTGIKYGGIVLCARYMYLSLVAIAGQVTIFDFAMKFAGSIEANRWIAYAFGFTGVGYGVVQRRIRKKRVAQLADRIKGLERRVDPDRSSSQLKEDGTTKEDY